MAIDERTAEAGMERRAAVYKAKGQFFIFDEAHELMKAPYWHPMTPRLLDHGVPDHHTVVLPDRRAFRWSHLNSDLQRLPDGYEEDLAVDPRYADLSPGDHKLSFFLTELVPQAYCSLAELMKEDRLLPHGFEILWLFGPRGTPLGRVLRNRDLGGIGPRLFGFDDEIFAAAGALMCGDVVDVPPAAGGVKVQVHRHRWKNDFDLAERLKEYKTPSGEPRIPLDQKEMVPLAGITYGRASDGTEVLSGETFIEAGQVYVRDHEPWLSGADVPIWLRRELGVAIDDSKFGVSRDAIPPASAALVSSAATAIDIACDRAAAHRPGGVSDLIGHVATLASWPALSGYLTRTAAVLVAEAFPDQEGLDQAEARESAVQRLTRWGKYLQERLPMLVEIAPLGLGMVFEEASDNYAGTADDLDPRQLGEGDLVVFAAGLLAYSVRYSAGLAAGHLDQAPATLIWTADLYRRGVIDAAKFPAALADLGALKWQVERQMGEIARIEHWRERENAQRDLRAAGRYLYASQPVSRVQPIGFAEAWRGFSQLGMSRGRKHAAAPPSEEQPILPPGLPGGNRRAVGQLLLADLRGVLDLMPVDKERAVRMADAIKKVGDAET
jgi:hypothetical protein